MGAKKFIKKQAEQVSSLFIPDKQKVERLRRILEAEQERPVSYKEAEEVGTHILSLYEHLAGDLRLTKGGLRNKKS